VVCQALEASAPVLLQPIEHGLCYIISGLRCVLILVFLACCRLPLGPGLVNLLHLVDSTRILLASAFEWQWAKTPVFLLAAGCRWVPVRQPAVSGSTGTFEADYAAAAAS
jgi:hypothetical protein